LQLQRTDLRGADLTGVDLARISLVGANLQEAWLMKANLEGADLEGANLQRAWLSGARLTRAYLTDARLEGATSGAAYIENPSLQVARLFGLEETNLDDIDIRAVDLQQTKGLIQEQLELVVGDADIKLPQGLQQPSMWDLEALEQREIIREQMIERVSSELGH
jgi:uncharacterized protein YjbI with pentapeptide repeats